MTGRYALRPGEAHLCHFLRVSSVVALLGLFPMYYLCTGTFTNHLPILCRSVKTGTSLSHPGQALWTLSPHFSQATSWPQDGPAYRLSGQKGQFMLYKVFKNLIFKIIFRCKGRYLMKLGTDIYGLVFSMSFCILATVHRKRYFAPAAQEITLQNPLQRLVEEFYHSIYLHLQHLQCWANMSMNW